jgi:hypothetical protein
MYNSIEAIASRIQKEVTGGVVSDDEVTGGPSLSLIKDMVHVERDAIIGMIKKNSFIQDDFYQRICCLEVKCEDESCYAETGLSKPYVEIPSIAQSIGIKAVKYIGTDNIKYWNGKVYRNEKFNYIIQGQKIILSQMDFGVKYLCVEAVFYNPEAAFSICGSNEEKPYSCPNEYLTHIEQRVVARLRNLKAMPRDIQNDAR